MTASVFLIGSTTPIHTVEDGNVWFDQGFVGVVLSRLHGGVPNHVVTYPTHRIDRVVTDSRQAPA